MTEIRQIPIPRLPLNVIARPRLERKLDQLAPLTVVSGGAGTGKTTLLATWARKLTSRGQVDQVAWLHISEPMGLPAGLPQTLDAFGESFVSANEAEVISSVPGARVPLSDVGSALLFSPDRRVVVLDQATLLKDHSVIRELVGSLIHSTVCHLVVSVSDAQDWLLASRSLGVQATHITGHDLRFDAKEIQQLGEKWGHELENRRTHELLELAGGWAKVTTQVLMDTASGEQNFSLEKARLSVKGTVVPQLKNILGASLSERLSVSNHLSLAVVEALTALEPTLNTSENDTLADLFFRLEELGLAVSKISSEGGLNWQFPRLLQETLLEEFVRREPGLWVAAHRAVADALYGELDNDSFLGEVLQHARKGEHWELLEQVWSCQSLALISEWPGPAGFAYENLPRSVIEKKPILALAEVVVASLWGKSVPLDALRVIGDCVDLEWTHSSDVNLFTNPNARLLALTVMVMARRAEGNYAGSSELAEHAAEVLSRQPLQIRTSISPFNRAWFEKERAISAMLAGDCGLALEVARKAYLAGKLAGADFVTSCASAQLALLDITDGAIPRANTWRERYRANNRLNPMARTRVTVMDLVASAMLDIERLNKRSALEFLEQANRHIVQASEMPHFVWATTQYHLLFGEAVTGLAKMPYIHGQAEYHRCSKLEMEFLRRGELELLIGRGELTRADSLLKRSPNDWAWLELIRARLLLITGEVQQALSIAAKQERNRLLSMRDKLDIKMIKIAAAWKLGEQKRAVDDFAKVGRIALEFGLLSPFVKLPNNIRAELITKAEVPLSHPEIERVEGHGNVYPMSGQIVQLTPRESVVLEELRSGNTLSCIANRLSVSVHTVKKQSISIYAKLGVSSRADALLAAEQLGLLS